MQHNLQNCALIRQVRHIAVSPEEAGQKIITCIERRLAEDVPRSALMRWFRTGQVRLDGRRVAPFERLTAGQIVRLPPCLLRDIASAPDQGPGSGLPGAGRSDAGRSAAGPPGDVRFPFPVVYEDAQLLVIDKLSGLPVQPGTGWTDCVQARILSAYPLAAFVPTAAHRLDRDPSGLLLLAKTYNKLSELHQLLRERGLRKEYLAWVAGRFPGRPGEVLLLDDLLQKQGEPGRERMRAGCGKQALTEVRLLEARDHASLVRLCILTGRTHQIRAQLAARGHPLIGDRKYGGPKGRIRLHAWRLHLPGLTLACPPPWTGEWAVGEEIEEENRGKLF